MLTTGASARERESCVTCSRIEEFIFGDIDVSKDVALKLLKLIMQLIKASNRIRVVTGIKNESKNRDNLGV